jgi:periplasmic protein TonB
MMEYLRANLTYPDQAQRDGVEGTIFVDFIIDKNGSVRDIIATDVVGENIDQALKDEAVRVVTGMPTWVPGTQRGVAVDARYSVPITFQLN